ncbi:tRNA uridine(34) 5-carboxymethylaminomethyl modification radical SAM/GNAT enzyme Elp3 [[Eubacterium] cellulosolvens]
MVSDFYGEMFELIISNEIKTKNEIHNAKIQLCRKHGLTRVPSDADILEHAPEEYYEIVEPILRTKPMRTISGVAPVAVMTSPEKCPHGTCGYCPGGVDQGSAQSYTGFEPASLRAGSFDFDPYLQTKSRLEQLAAIGHPTDKIDLIIMGGTFTARPVEYQNCFITGCFAALNNEPVWDTQADLEQLHEANERARHRCIGMTIETRPDWCKQQHVDKILNLGGTRVELGVQTVFDDVLVDVSRGHTVLDSIEATQVLKDSGLKVCYHLMPGLPGSGKERDMEMFDKIFDEPAFRPDMLKIYPTLVVKGTELFERWQRQEYEPLNTENAVDLIVHLKTHLPPWVRIQRIQRDIPVQYIDGGVDKSNLRQLVHRALEERGMSCNCIRCREVGHQSLRGHEPEMDNIKLQTITYAASSGSEVFISYEDAVNTLLIAFIRLRLPSSLAYRTEFQAEKTAVIRELKVFGPMVPLNGKQDGQTAVETDLNPTRPWQHQGYGQLLLSAAERYAREHWGVKKMLVMSGVGVKPYYAKFGYKKDGVYMAKELL